MNKKNQVFLKTKPPQESVVYSIINGNNNGEYGTVCIDKDFGEAAIKFEFSSGVFNILCKKEFINDDILEVETLLETLQIVKKLL